MKRYALFPGQGAQTIGMAKDFIADIPEAKARFDQASDVLGRNLAKICCEGPEEKLNATNNCQPALLVSSLVVFEFLERELGWTAESYAGMAGLSLGEITALVAAASLDFEDGVKLVEARGRFMQQACDTAKSSMTSVIGLTRQEAEALADDVREPGKILTVANINAPTQMVFSGDPQLLAVVAEKVAQAGKRAIPLTVAGAFHSDYMKPADLQLSGLLSEMDIKEPKVPVLSNVDALAHGTSVSIKDKLSRQIVSSVLWNECMQNLPDGAICYELGVGKVLTGLMRKINRAIKISPVNTVEDARKINIGEASA